MQRQRGRPLKDSELQSATSWSQVPAKRPNPEDTGILLSQDRRRTRTVLLENVPKKRRLLPSQLACDELSKWQPDQSWLDDDSANMAQWDSDFLESVGPVVDEDEMEMYDGTTESTTEETAKNRTRRYSNSDFPMKSWLNHSSEFLDEILRDSGLADCYTDPKCCNPSCKSNKLSTTSSPNLVRCFECGPLVWCPACCVNSHQLLPLHSIARWTGKYWADTNLRELGLVFHLGHGGKSCPCPKTPRDMTIIDDGSISTVRVSYCGCDLSDHTNKIQQLLRNRWYPATVVDPETCATFKALERYRLLNVVANVNVRDYVSYCEVVSDAGRTGEIADRYKAFGRMYRQYAYLLRLKRRGRGHESGGIVGTPAGALAIPCWACPREGVNLPSNWREVDPQYGFLYQLFVAMDANFRMKHRLRKRARDDPPLGPGLGCLIDEEPYREFLKDYTSEKDISSCIAFMALMQKDSRITSGLRSSGVAAISCARHELVRPLGMGDLQKGERYANMDYILACGLLGWLGAIFLTYDIWCQYFKLLLSRMARLPEGLKWNDGEEKRINGALPIWHGEVHVIQCRNQHLVQYQRGAGKTDGEGPERIWSLLNALAYATKEMGVGTRHDAIEDRLDYHNFRKNIKLGKTLIARHRLAVLERSNQQKDFQEVDASIDKTLRAQWRKELEEWYLDQEKPSPFSPTIDDGVSEAEVRRQLRKDDTEAASKGEETVHETSPTGFLTLGLELEELQIRIRAAGSTSSQVSVTEQRRYRFFRRLKNFRQLQETYMPVALEELRKEEQQRDPDLPAPQAEDIKLWLPSEVIGRRLTGSQRSLPTKEARLRRAQCEDSLKHVRSRLYAKRHLIIYRNTHVTGQRDSTRARTLIDSVGDKVLFYQSKYNRARHALVALEGLEVEKVFPELKREDLALDVELVQDEDATRRLGSIGSQHTRIHGGAGGRSNEGSGEGRQGRKGLLSSWIWRAVGDSKDQERENEAVRVEWCKAFARKERWEEEVDLLEEEMRRVVRSVDYEETEWRRRAGGKNEDHDKVMASGFAAYALRQAAFYHSVGEQLRVQMGVKRVQDS